MVSIKKQCNPYGKVHFFIQNVKTSLSTKKQLVLVMFPTVIMIISWFSGCICSYDTTKSVNVRVQFPYFKRMPRNHLIKIEIDKHNLWGWRTLSCFCFMTAFLFWDFITKKCSIKHEIHNELHFNTWWLKIIVILDSFMKLTIF